MFAEIAGTKIGSHTDFNPLFSKILNKWFGKGPINGPDLEMVQGLFELHPERAAKLSGCAAVSFISDRKDETYQRSPTFRVVRSDGRSISFGISTVYRNLRASAVRA